MNADLINSIAKYVEQHIGEFHRNRIAKLQSVNLKELLSRKNPYLFNLNNSYRFYFHESFVDIRIHSLQLT